MSFLDMGNYKNNGIAPTPFFGTPSSIAPPFPPNPFQALEYTVELAAKASRV